VINNHETYAETKNNKKQLKLPEPKHKLYDSNDVENRKGPRKKLPPPPPGMSFAVAEKLAKSVNKFFFANFNSFSGKKPKRKYANRKSLITMTTSLKTSANSVKRNWLKQTLSKPRKKS
jgi:hypothetical protein